MAVATRPVQASPRSNPYGAPPPAARVQGRSRGGNHKALIAACAALVVIVVGTIVGVVVSGSGSTTRAASSPSRPLVVSLPEHVAGLSLRHDADARAETAKVQSFGAGAGKAVGYYETPAGRTKVFVEIADTSALTGLRPTALRQLHALEDSFTRGLTPQQTGGQTPLWATVSAGDASVLMACSETSLSGVPVKTCAFVEGTVVGYVGVYLPTSKDAALVNQIRAAAVHR